MEPHSHKFQYLPSSLNIMKVFFRPILLVVLSIPCSDGATLRSPLSKGDVVEVEAAPGNLVDPSFSENPYDSDGMAHNQVIADLEDFLTDRRGDISDYVDALVQMAPKTASILDPNMDGDTREGVTAMVQSIILTPKSAEEWTRLRQDSSNYHSGVTQEELERTKEYHVALWRVETLSDFLATSREMEISVINSDWSDESKFRFLTMAAISRYSAAFWTDYVAEWNTVLRLTSVDDRAWSHFENQCWQQPCYDDIVAMAGAVSSIFGWMLGIEVGEYLG